MPIAHIQVIGAKIDFVLLAALVIDEPGREGVMDRGAHPGAAVTPDRGPAAVDNRYLGLEALNDPAMSTPNCIGGNSSAFLGRFGSAGGSCGVMVFMPLLSSVKTLALTGQSFSHAYRRFKISNHF